MNTFLDKGYNKEKVKMVYLDCIHNTHPTYKPQHVDPLEVKFVTQFQEKIHSMESIIKKH